MNIRIVNQFITPKKLIVTFICIHGKCLFHAVYQNLHRAAEIGQMSRVTYFVENGAGVNIKDAKKVSIKLCNCIKLVLIA